MRGSAGAYYIYIYIYIYNIFSPVWNTQVRVDMVQQPGLGADLLECAVAAIRNLCVNCQDNQARPRPRDCL